MTNYSSRNYKKFWDIKKLYELQTYLEKGLPYLKIANKMNVSLNAIMVARKRYGLKALSKQFMTPQSISREMGIPCQKRDWVLEMREGIKFYSTGESAKIKFTTVRTVNGWIRKGWLKAEKKGFNWFILRDNLLKFEPPGMGGNFNHRFLAKIN